MATEACETGTLIGSDKVEGTAVYGADRQKIGSIERVMIDKMSGKVSSSLPLVILLSMSVPSTGGPGDKLHANRAGYAAMGNAIDLAMVTAARK